MNKRQLNLEKYGISKKRYKELCGFCEQYPEWKKRIPLLEGTNALESLAMHREKCELIERTALMASEEFAKYLIKSICYEVPVTYLIACDGMPCSPNTFYDTRRYFFYLLDKNKKM